MATKLLKFMAGVAFGAAAGAAAGLLMAPTPGPEVKGHIRQRVDEAIEVGKRAAAQREAELLAEFEQARKRTPA
ncbi:MAG: YtxH domain-containing protein [Anaerolineae bacterium]|nr:YtxH domain-containing protein [Anaerolineae bacterium]